MLTLDESLRFAALQYTPQSFAGVLAAEVRRLQAEVERLRAELTARGWMTDGEPVDGQRVMAATISRLHPIHGQFRRWPFPRIVASDGAYITEYYAWMPEPEMPLPPEPAP